MFTIAIDVTLLIEVVVLPLGAIILGVTVYFFLQTRKSLTETVAKQERIRYPVLTMEKERPAVSVKEYELTEIREQLRSLKERNISEMLTKTEPKTATLIKEAKPKEDLTDSLKATIAQQQKLLVGFLKQVEEIESENKEELSLENNKLQTEIERLESIIEKKNNELNELRKQSSRADEMAHKIEDVYQEFEQLQVKMETMEKQANRANNLAIELEDTRQSYEQLYKDVTRKQEKLDEAFDQVQNMRKDLEEMEDKLAEANLQRQQLQKKVQFLQDLNTDMQSMSETNKKLQSELKRIGELESMLNMMAEERDYLLSKKSGK